MAMTFKKMQEACSKGFKNMIDQGYSIPVAFIEMSIGVLVGLAVAFGLNYSLAFGISYVYNALAENFNWPTFSIWFWFILILFFIEIKNWGCKEE